MTFFFLNRIKYRYFNFFFKEMNSTFKHSKSMKSNQYFKHDFNFYPLIGILNGILANECIFLYLFSLFNFGTSL